MKEKLSDLCREQKQTITPHKTNQDVAENTDLSVGTVATIAAYLTEAMGYAAAGITPPKQPRDIALPDELIEALDADPELAEAFHALTPGRQKSYAILLNSAKTSATRVARIEKARDKIFAGKGATEY